ncbi:hypothetical protein L2E82_47940 [Cichorium intybus]|uniref:Uncharacterized protein n=1 Tax=Cichorium intybus TaxID=13427 RepID=A0ACB8YX43_CICIN|nr:hypothetical protein L2E82_47940 [Cichorium intybus]
MRGKRLYTSEKRTRTRSRINEKLKALQKLILNSNKMETGNRWWDQKRGFGFGAPAGGTSSIFSQNNTFGQMSANQTPSVAQPQSITNPFGTLPAMPQMSIGRAGNAPSIQYGISSLPVVNKPAPIRISSVLTSRHLSQRRIRLPARKLHPKNDGPKVSFFSDEEETTGMLFLCSSDVLSIVYEKVV